MIAFFTEDQYALYVTTAYAATALILTWLVWSTARASARARREMDEAERRRSTPR